MPFWSTIRTNLPLVWNELWRRLRRRYFRLDSSRLFYLCKLNLVLHTKCWKGAFCKILKHIFNHKMEVAWQATRYLFLVAWRWKPVASADWALLEYSLALSLWKILATSLNRPDLKHHWLTNTIDQTLKMTCAQVVERVSHQQTVPFRTTLAHMITTYELQLNYGMAILWSRWVIQVWCSFKPAINQSSEKILRLNNNTPPLQSLIF